MYARDYRLIARNHLAGNWLLSVAVTFVAALLGGLVTGGGSSFELKFDQESFPAFYETLKPLIDFLLAYSTISGIVSFVLGGTIRQGYCRYLLNQYDRNDKSMSDLFSQFHRFGDGFCLKLLQGIFVALWSLLFIIPGIVAGYRYAMAPFILLEHPDYTASDAIRASKEMMYGHKLELFCLDFSFIGWSILCMFTLGIGDLFLNPYRNAAHAAFYRQISSTQNVN